jgi:hypothetical protein
MEEDLGEDADRIPLFNGQKHIFYMMCANFESSTQPIRCQNAKYCADDFGPIAESKKFPHTEIRFFSYYDAFKLNYLMIEQRWTMTRLFLS